MASELVNKIKKLQSMIVKKNNEQFKKNAVEILNPDKADEDLFVAPSMAFPDDIDEQPQDNAPQPADEPVIPDPVEKPLEQVAPEEIETHALLEIEAMIRKSISEEQEAAAHYIKRAAKCIKHGNDKLAALFNELASDEIVHAASLETALDMYNMFDPYKFLQGQAEAEYILQESEDKIAKKEEKDREDAEKAKKDFDFVREYTKDKAEYEKEKIVNAINDLILGKSAVDDVVDVVLKSAKTLKKDKKKDKKAEK